MIISKQYLNEMIKQETRFVITERQIRMIEGHISDLENTEFFQILKEQIGDVTQEELQLLKEFFGKIKDKIKDMLSKTLTAGVNTIKRLLELILGTIREVFILTGGAAAATSILGTILTQTQWGAQLISGVMQALQGIVSVGTQVGTFAAQTVNHIAAGLKLAGLPVPDVIITDPASIGTFFKTVMGGAKTVVTTIMSLDPTILAAIAIGAVAAGFVVWLMSGGFKKMGLELKGRGLLATLKGFLTKKKT